MPPNEQCDVSVASGVGTSGSMGGSLEHPVSLTPLVRQSPPGEARAPAAAPTLVWQPVKGINGDYRRRRLLRCMRFLCASRLCCSCSVFSAALIDSGSFAQLPFKGCTFPGSDRAQALSQFPGTPRWSSWTCWRTCGWTAARQRPPRRCCSRASVRSCRLVPLITKIRNYAPIRLNFH